MNGTEPRASDIRAMEADLRPAPGAASWSTTAQASDKTAERMRQIAHEEAHVTGGRRRGDVAGRHVTSYQAWVGRTLDAVEQG